MTIGTVIHVSLIDGLDVIDLARIDVGRHDGRHIGYVHIDVSLGTVGSSDRYGEGRRGTGTRVRTGRGGSGTRVGTTTGASHIGIVVRRRRRCRDVGRIVAA